MTTLTAVPEQLSALVSRRAAGSEPVCLYCYDLGMLTEHVAAVVAALPDRCRMFYAMKANSAPPLLQALAPLVDGFEVASGGELTKARAVGEHIPVLFGGPVKTAQEIAQALEQRVERLHVESVLELHRVSEVATRVGRSLNFDPLKEQIIGDDEANKLVSREYREHWGTPKGV